MSQKHTAKNKFILYKKRSLNQLDSKMALNPQYEEIGKGFVQQYYLLFDNPSTRSGLVNFYNVSTKIEV